VDLSWSAASNQSAKDAFKTQPENLDPGKVVAAVACSIGPPPAGPVDQTACSQIDAAKALMGLEALGKFVDDAGAAPNPAPKAQSKPTSPAKREDTNE
jgi:hypothetical protein